MYKHGLRMGISLRFAHCVKHTHRYTFHRNRHLKRENQGSHSQSQQTFLVNDNKAKTTQALVKNSGIADNVHFAKTSEQRSLCSQTSAATGSTLLIMALSGLHWLHCCQDNSNQKRLGYQAESGQVSVATKVMEKALGLHDFCRNMCCSRCEESLGSYSNV